MGTSSSQLFQESYALVDGKSYGGPRRTWQNMQGQELGALQAQSQSQNIQNQLQNAQAGLGSYGVDWGSQTVTSITVTSPGVDYYEVPTIGISGGAGITAAGIVYPLQQNNGLNPSGDWWLRQKIADLERQLMATQLQQQTKKESVRDKPTDAAEVRANGGKRAIEL